MKSLPRILWSLLQTLVLHCHLMISAGYASFSYLKKFPFDAIKIDKSFVDQMLFREDTEIVRSIVQIAKKLDLKVTIEGIESEVQEQFIVEEGCDVGQGYSTVSRCLAKNSNTA